MDGLGFGDGHCSGRAYAKPRNASSIVRLGCSDDLAKQGELGAAELFGPLAVSAGGEDHSELEFGNDQQALPAVPNARRPGEIATVRAARARPTSGCRRETALCQW